MTIFSRIIFSSIFLLVCGVAAAQNGVALSGIMGGDHPMAIVNDQLVAAGDSVGNYKVVEIGNDYVVLEGKKGRFTVRLKEDGGKKKAPVASGSKPAMTKRPSPSGATPSMPPAVAQQGSGPVPVSEKAGKRLDRSMDALRQADAYLKTPIKTDNFYVKAIGLCDEAANEAQAALKDIRDESSRKPILEHIAKVQKVKTAIVREKEDLNTRVRTAIVNRQVFQGMTTQNVISSWGAPLTKTTVGAQERWAYKDPNGYQKNLSFSEGILVAF